MILGIMVQNEVFYMCEYQIGHFDHSFYAPGISPDIFKAIWPILMKLGTVVQNGIAYISE